MGFQKTGKAARVGESMTYEQIQQAGPNQNGDDFSMVAEKQVKKPEPKPTENPKKGN